MRIRYGKCNNVDCNINEDCPRKYKIYMCCKTEKVNFYECYDHNSDNINYKKRGISESTKKIIENLIYNYDARPIESYNNSIGQALNSEPKKRGPRSAKQTQNKTKQNNNLSPRVLRSRNR